MVSGHLLHDSQSMLRRDLWIDMLLLNHLDSHIQLTHLALVHLHTYRTARLNKVRCLSEQAGSRHPWATMSRQAAGSRHNKGQIRAGEQ